MAQYTTVTVAVMGLNGLLGKPVLDALQSSTFRDKYSFPIKAIGRDTSNLVDTETVKYISASSDDPVALAKALEGTSVLIDLTGAGNYNNIVDAAVKAGVELYFPPIYAADYSKATEFKEPFRFKHDILEYSRSQNLKTVELMNGVIGDWQLRDKPFLVPGSLEKGEPALLQMGRGDSKVAHTFVDDIARTIVALAYRRPASSMVPDRVRVYGDLITQQEYIPLFEKATGKKLSKVIVPADEARKQALEAKEALAKEFQFENVFKIISSLYADRSDVFDFSEENENELVNPGESLWKWKKVSDVTPDEWRKYGYCD